jgi:MoaA/NifB/PqqE/SkfB family radical SAM enzyme
MREGNLDASTLKPADGHSSLRPTDQEYLLEFRRKVEHLRIPLSGSIAITHQCNLRCLHCYLGGETDLPEQRRQELKTPQIFKIIDDAREAGCLFLLITGGEPLLRSDFTEIYRHAKSQGLVTTVFTNGTLMTDRVVKIFEEFPPLAVEITLYGATAETYEKITGVSGSYRRCIQGIERLLDRRINLRLKTVMMTPNRHEFYDMQNLAGHYGVKFRVDAGVFPRFDGDPAPLHLRLPSEEVVEKEFSDSERLQQYESLYRRFRGVPGGDTLYTCGAGLTSFHVDASGLLQPCVMVRSLQYDLSQGDFMTGYARNQERKNTGWVRLWPVR